MPCGNDLSSIVYLSAILRTNKLHTQGASLSFVGGPGRLISPIKHLNGTESRGRVNMCENAQTTEVGIVLVKKVVQTSIVLCIHQ